MRMQGSAVRRWWPPLPKSALAGAVIKRDFNGRFCFPYSPFRNGNSESCWVCVTSLYETKPGTNSFWQALTESYRKTVIGPSHGKKSRETKINQNTHHIFLDTEMLIDYRTHTVISCRISFPCSCNSCCNEYIWWGCYASLWNVMVSRLALCLSYIKQVHANAFKFELVITSYTLQTIRSQLLSSCSMLPAILDTRSLDCCLVVAKTVL